MSYLAPPRRCLGEIYQLLDEPLMLLAYCWRLVVPNTSVVGVSRARARSPPVSCGAFQLINACSAQRPTLTTRTCNMWQPGVALAFRPSAVAEYPFHLYFRRHCRCWPRIRVAIVRRQPWLPRPPPSPFPQYMRPDRQPHSPHLNATSAYHVSGALCGAGASRHGFAT
jgi:hypothetical protein